MSNQSLTHLPPNSGNARLAPRNLAAAGYRLSSCAAGDADRKEAEAFVRAAFLKTHRAEVATFMPTLLLLREPRGGLLGVAGYRIAESTPLYLERYLSLPVEQVIAARCGVPVQRSKIVEVGNFACVNSEAARRFVCLLPFHLLELRLTWIAFTATATVRRILDRVGAPCAELGSADGACAAGGADRWGKYYEQDPQVMAGYLPMARKLPELLGAAYAD